MKGSPQHQWEGGRGGGTQSSDSAALSRARARACFFCFTRSLRWAALRRAGRLNFKSWAGASFLALRSGFARMACNDDGNNGSS